MDFLLLELIKVSCTICVAFFGVFCIISEFFSTNLPIGLCIILIIPVIFHLIRVKPPSENYVENIIGKDPFLLPDEPTGNDENKYIMRCVGHRGCGLDAPENSLNAFNLVSTHPFFSISPSFNVIFSAMNVDVMQSNLMSD